MSEHDEMHQRRGPSFGSVATPGLIELVRSQSISGHALDLGCGDGRDALHLARAGLKVDACDDSPLAIAKLQRFSVEQGLAENIILHCESVSEMEIAAAQYNLIVGITILDHLTTGQIEQLWPRLLNGVAPSGWIFLQVHTVEDPGFGNDPTSSEYARFITHHFAKGELLRMIPYQWYVRFYEERLELDNDHGPSHWHGFAVAAAQRV